VLLPVYRMMTMGVTFTAADYVRMPSMLRDDLVDWEIAKALAQDKGQQEGTDGRQ